MCIWSCYNKSQNIQRTGLHNYSSFTTMCHGSDIWHTCILRYIERVLVLTDLFLLLNTLRPSGILVLSLQIHFCSNSSLMLSETSLSGCPLANWRMKTRMSSKPLWPCSLKCLPTLWTVVLFCTTFLKCSQSLERTLRFVCPTYIFWHAPHVMQ